MIVKHLRDLILPRDIFIDIFCINDIFSLNDYFDFDSQIDMELKINDNSNYFSKVYFNIVFFENNNF
jgi:hypothetical protein